MVESGSCISRKCERVSLIDSGIPTWVVDRIIKTQNSREQDNAIQIHILQQSAQDCRARRAVGFAKQILGGVPAVVICEKPANEAFKSMRVLIDAQEAFLVRS